MDYQAWIKLMQESAKNPQNIDEQIKSLKQIESWLQINLTMVQNSVQYLTMLQNMSNNTAFNPNNINEFLKGLNTASDNNNYEALQSNIMKASTDWMENIKKMQDSWKDKK